MDVDLSRWLCLRFNYSPVVAGQRLLILMENRIFAQSPVLNGPDNPRGRRMVRAIKSDRICSSPGINKSQNSTPHPPQFMRAEIFFKGNYYVAISKKFHKDRFRRRNLQCVIYGR